MTATAAALIPLREETAVRAYAKANPSQVMTRCIRQCSRGTMHWARAARILGLTDENGNLR